MMCRHTARACGLLLGGSTGTVPAAVRALRGALAPGATVLALSPGPGDRCRNTVYDDDWVCERFGVRDPAGLDATGMAKAQA
ncbi:hypothetical protein AB0C81_34955 [Streptomyces roseoverticillatus]|uniref:hypothetical protein n=1 Tax=Streptomyces roseoverticillatus TaxID=66429 RepID=UPI0033EC7B20